MLSDQELRDNIAAAGCLDPVLVWMGLVIDGRRRHQICEALGITPPMVVFVTLEAACTALFAKHPERAIKLAQEHLGGHAGLAPTLRELAAVCHAPPSAVALILQADRPRSKRAPHRTRSQRSEGIKLWVEPQWLHHVRECGARLGMNLSQTIRVACWEFVQRNSPRQPTEGSKSGPSPEWVRKPELRRPTRKH